MRDEDLKRDERGARSERKERARDRSTYAYINACSPCVFHGRHNILCTFTAQQRQEREIGRQESEKACLSAGRTQAGVVLVGKGGW